MSIDGGIHAGLAEMARLGAACGWRSVRGGIDGRRRLHQPRRARHDVLRREQGHGGRRRRPIRRNGKTRRRSSSPTRRSRIRPSTRTSSSRSRRYLSQCLNKKVVFYQVQSNAAEIEAMRSGRLHVGGFSTGPTAFAVNLAGAVPFAHQGHREGVPGLQPDRHRQGELAVPEDEPTSRARRSRTRRRRRIPAISRRSRCSPRKA